ncbi:MAG: glycerol-3-phosphate acyltransferase, partial [Deltaproteobacteria bacterium]|nr:glycerol-3-phosphate acyltransferase [Deltaproteobacteria bacterium]
MKTITIISFIIFSYLCGSLPIGVILSKLKGKDPREIGSKNIGATNVMRAAGKFLGILTLIGDIAKGAVPVILACLFFDNPYIIVISALAAFIGHIFPIFLKFKGGKGVATAVGVYLVISPLSVVMAI